MTEEQIEGLIVLEPRSDFDPFIIGTVQRFNVRFVLYCRRCIIEFLADGIADDDDRYEQAVEHFDFNIVGGWYGDTTPAFLEGDDEHHYHHHHRP